MHRTNFCTQCSLFYFSNSLYKCKSSLFF